ncbi:MAG: ATP-binding protein, partial [Pseudomonadota bacterium]
MAASQYDAADIEVLSGLDPVKKRPGMYTDTTRPNHLAQEVIDNSVDEALAGHANQIEVCLYKDNSLSVTDNGRGMPIDIHPEEKVSGVELILTRLHAGGKFSRKNYQYSGGLHGVGVSVVNALSSHLEVQIRRGGNVHHMTFADGDKKTKLKIIGTCAKKDTGSMVRFLPNGKYFDVNRFAVPAIKSLLRAKAVLCPKLRMIFVDENTGERTEWYYEDGLKDYLSTAAGSFELLPSTCCLAKFSNPQGEVEWAIQWWLDATPNELITESYV